MSNVYFLRFKTIKEKFKKLKIKRTVFSESIVTASTSMPTGADRVLEAYRRRDV